MDFRFTPEQQAWRRTVGAFLDSITPPDYPGTLLPTVPPVTDEEYRAARAIHRALAGRGWLVLAWPQEYGGADADVIDQLIFTEEYTYRRLPHLGPGVSFIGPSLMIHGSAEQQARHLPPIARAEEVWCQGFSEPGTGSDLASLQTRAIRDGNDYLVTGTKIWTTNAHRADWIWLAVRTNPEGPKHRGLSVLLVDRRSPGITITPVRDLAGGHSFNQVHLDAVRVPATNLVGAHDDGWRVLTTTLDHERSSIANAAFARRLVEEMINYARSTVGSDGRPLSGDPVLAAQLAERATEVAIARQLAYRTASLVSRGQTPGREASISKLFGSELLQRLAQTGIALVGPRAAARETDSFLRRPIAEFALQTISSTIAGGAAEIQRGIIATRGLGMPRSL